MQKAPSERIAELDILRAFAIFAVILIHTISGVLYSTAWNSYTFALFVAIDQFCRFSVPLFVALSGYTLTLRYQDREIKFGEFFKRRVLRLVPWYLFWSAAVLLYIRTSVLWNNAQHFPFWKIVFLGKADYHLYFVPMIFQLYLLFPLLIFLARKWGKWLLFLFFLTELAFYFVLSEFALGKVRPPFFLNDQQQYLFFGTWVFYFVLGIFLAFGNKFASFLKKYSAWILVILFLSFVWEVANTLILITSTHDLTLATRSTRIPVMIYAGFFCIAVFLQMNNLSLIDGKLRKFLVAVGQRSYIIYLLHTIPLRVFSTYFKPTSLVSTLLLFIVIALTSDYLAQVSLIIARNMHKRFLYRRVDEI